MTAGSPLQRGLIRTLDALRVKEWLKPIVLDLLEFAGVEHSFARTPQVFERLSRLGRPTPGNQSGTRVLVLSFRGAWLLHGTWEAIIAEALRRRGASPTLFVCSGGLPEVLPGKSPACGIASAYSPGPASCSDCLKCGLTLASAFNLPVLRLDDFVDKKKARALMAEVEALDDSQISSLEHRGLPIGEYITNSARWCLCVSDLDFPDGQRVTRSFAKSARVVSEAVPGLLDRVKPEVVFLLNGLFFAERIVKAEAERRGIRVVSYERGFMPNTLCFGEGIPAYYDLSPLWESVKDTPLTPTEEARLDAYLAERRRGLRAPFQYWPTITEDAKEVLEALSLDAARPTAVLFTNITWDSAAQDRDVMFPSMYGWVLACVRHFAQHHESQLVVRIHPAEVRVPGWETRDPLLNHLRKDFPVLPPNIKIVPPESDLSSYTLMTLSRCGLVYTSTAGLELAMEGLPVIVAGNVHYGGKGFTWDPKDREDYLASIEKALDASRDPLTQERARRYAYAFFFRYFLPFPLVSENAPDFVPTLESEDPAVLDPGADTTLDLVCRGILTGGGFFAP